MQQFMGQFAQRVGFIIGLQQNGKLTEEEAYSKIKILWKKLKKVYKKGTHG